MQSFLNFKYSKVVFFILFFIFIFILRSFILKEDDNRLVAVVEKTSLIDIVKVSSVYKTSMQKDVYSTADGVITDLFVKNGNIVEKGDLLFHVDSTATQEEKASAYADYMKALSTYNQAKQAKLTLQGSLEEERQNILAAQATLDDQDYDRSVGDDNPSTGRKYTQAEIDSKNSALIAARYNFTSVEKQYLEADQNIASNYANFKSKKLGYDATKSIDIISPAMGEVLNLLKGVNDGVSAAQTGKPVLVIANLSNPSLIVPINELDISRIKVNQEAQIVFDAYKDIEFKGVVESIDTIGNNQGVINYDVKIVLLDITDKIKPGMTAIVSIETLRKDEVITVPNSAVGFDDQQAYVYRLDKPNGKEEKITVELGLKGMSDYEITSGIQQGDLILANIASGR